MNIKAVKTICLCFLFFIFACRRVVDQRMLQHKDVAFVLLQLEKYYHNNDKSLSFISTLAPEERKLLVRLLSSLYWQPDSSVSSISQDGIIAIWRLPFSDQCKEELKRVMLYSGVDMGAGYGLIYYNSYDDGPFWKTLAMRKDITTGDKENLWYHYSMTFYPVRISSFVNSMMSSNDRFSITNKKEQYIFCTNLVKQLQNDQVCVVDSLWSKKYINDSLRLLREEKGLTTNAIPLHFVLTEDLELLRIYIKRVRSKSRGQVGVIH